MNKAMGTAPSATPAAQAINNQRERRLPVTRKAMFARNTPAPPATANEMKIMKKPTKEDTNASNPLAINERINVVPLPVR